MRCFGTDRQIKVGRDDSEVLTRLKRALPYVSNTASLRQNLQEPRFVPARPMPLHYNKNQQLAFQLNIHDWRGRRIVDCDPPIAILHSLSPNLAFLRAIHAAAISDIDERKQKESPSVWPDHTVRPNIGMPANPALQFPGWSFQLLRTNFATIFNYYHAYPNKDPFMGRFCALCLPAERDGTTDAAPPPATVQFSSRQRSWHETGVLMMRLRSCCYHYTVSRLGFTHSS